MFAIVRLDSVARTLQSGAKVPDDAVVVSAARLRALLDEAYEDVTTPTIERALADAVEGLEGMFPRPPARCYVRAPEGACDVLVVEEESSTCVGCGWAADDHDKAVQEAARAWAAPAPAPPPAEEPF